MENPYGNCSSHSWAQWLSPHQTSPPLHDAIPNTVPWDKLSVRHCHGVKLVCQHRPGASLCCSILAAREMQVLQGEERKGLVITGCTWVLMPHPCSRWELAACSGPGGREAPTLPGKTPHGLTVPQTLETKLQTLCSGGEIGQPGRTCDDLSVP